MHAFYPPPNIYGKWSTTSWSKSSKTCNFEICPKLTSIKFQRWQFSNFHSNIFFLFFCQKNQIQVLYNSTKSKFQNSNNLHDILNVFVRFQSNFWIGTILVKCQLRVKFGLTNFNLVYWLNICNVEQPKKNKHFLFLPCYHWRCVCNLMKFNYYLCNYLTCKFDHLLVNKIS